MLSHSRTQHVAQLGLAALTLALTVAAPLAPTATVMAQSSANVACPDPGPKDYPIAAGWFYTQEGRGCVLGVGPTRRRGYKVVDDSQAAFWTEFRRYGGVDVLGFPVSQRFNYPPQNDNGFVYQAFERGILQWHPETGRADMANVFEMFTEQGLDPSLLALGIPLPQAADLSLKFASDAERRMSWLSEPRFLARYFFDPVAPHSSEPLRLGQGAFDTQEQAWSFFGLPQSLPGQPFLMDGQVSLDPLVHSFLAQRFQKGGMELFLQAPPNETFAPDGWTGSPAFMLDPTIVPGDGVQGCLALTAVGLLARTLGANRIVATSAIQALPLVPSAPPWVDSFVPKTALGQLMVQFQLSGIDFAGGEPVTVSLVDAHPSATGASLPSASQVVKYVNSDGSWDTVMEARVGTYVITATDKSGKMFTGILDLTTPTLGLSNTATPVCHEAGVSAGGADATPVPTLVTVPSSPTTPTTPTISLGGPATVPTDNSTP